MTELHAVFYFDSAEPVSREGRLDRLSASRMGHRYHRHLRHGNADLILESDRPAEPFVFDNPEITLICRADLLQGGVNEFPAAHLASLYLMHGDGFVRNLRGTFAIVLYDHRQRILKAWTDHFGAQRLVYTQSREYVAISTDLRVLVNVSGKTPEIDLDVIPQYLQFTCIPTPKTIYTNFLKLAPGSQLTANRQVSVHSYWDISYKENFAKGDETVWSSETAREIRSAVARSLEGIGSTERAGCFLSGGTDSSSIAGLTGELTRRAPKTFSIGFDDPRYNEIQYARIAAKKFHADHHEYFVKPNDILELAQKAAVVYDEPFGNSSIIPTYYCARLAAESGVTHLLAGDGGDELFGGNSRYAHDRVFQRYGRIPRWIRRSIIEPTIFLAEKRVNNHFFSRALSYIQRSNIDPPDRYFSYSLVSSVPGGELFTADFFQALHCDHSLEPARRHFRTARASNELNRWLYLDLKIIITDNDLRKVTTMSNFAGITVRYPLLDPALAEFSGTIPSDLKVRGTRLRYLFKKAMGDVLPTEIITKTKHGFGLPYSVWLAEHKPLRDFTFDVLGSDRCRQRGYFRRDLLEWLWSQYETVHRGYYGDLLWVFMMLELWHLAQANRSTDQPSSILASSRIS